jgi:hypothetical protein
MEWIPSSGWLTKVAVDGTAGQIGYDLAVDASGARRPSAIDAGLAMPPTAAQTQAVDLGRLAIAVAFVSVGLLGVVLIGASRSGRRAAGA